MKIKLSDYYCGTVEGPFGLFDVYEKSGSLEFFDGSIRERLNKSQAANIIEQCNVVAWSFMPEIKWQWVENDIAL